MINILLLCHNRASNLKILLDDITSSSEEIELFASIDFKDEVTTQLILNVLSEYNIRTIVWKPQLGLKNAVISGIEWFFSYVTTGVILEEDLRVNVDLLSSTHRFWIENIPNSIINLMNFSRFDAALEYGLIKSYDFYMWGWICSRDNWKNIYYSSFLEIKFPPISKIYKYYGLYSCIYWITIFVLIKQKQINSWGIPFLFELINKNIPIYSSTRSICMNAGFSYGENYSKISIINNYLLKSNIIYDKKNFNSKILEGISNKDAHYIRHNINLYQTIKNLIFIMLPIRKIIKRLYLKL